MSIWDQSIKTTSPTESGTTNLFKNARNNKATVDTSYGANTSSINKKTQLPLWYRLVGGNYNGMTYGDYFSNPFKKFSENNGTSVSSPSPATPQNSGTSESSVYPTTPQNSPSGDATQVTQIDTAHLNKNNTEHHLSSPDIPIQNTQTSAGQETAISSSPPATTASVANPATSAWSETTAIDSYEEYLRKKEAAYWNIYREQTSYYDEHNRQTLAAIDEQHQAALAEAENQKNMADTAATEQKNAALNEAENQRTLLINMSEEQKNAVYSFAEEQRISDMNYAAQQYQILLDSINAQRESGMAMAEEQRQILLSMSEEQRNTAYTSAERQRIATEQRADVERERGVVDARSSYEQNKASYGANAEAMAGMGLTGSGYSDYINQQTYAQQRAETQAANAQADASKREARYNEDQARLQADSNYYQNKYNAEQAYSDRKYEIDSTYQTNMLNAEQNKAQSSYEAESAERETRFNADQAHVQNEYAAESGYGQSKYDAETAERDAKLQSSLSYRENLFNAESQARSDKLTSEQTAETGKFSTEMSYRQNILENDDTIGEYRRNQAEEAEAEAKAAAKKPEEEAQNARAVYTELLSGANTGAYTAEQLEQLAADYGLSDAQKQSLINAANEYTTKKHAATNAELSASTGNSMDYIEDAVASGAISEAQGKTQMENVQKNNYNSFAEDIAYGYADTDAIDEAYSNGDISQTQYDDLKNKWNNTIDTSANTFYNADGTARLKKSAAKLELTKICNSKWCNEETKNVLNAVYKALYTPAIGGSNKNGSLNELADSGNNFTVTYDGKDYKVESAGEVTDSNLKEVAENVGDNKMFGYDGKIYIKKNGRVFEIRQRKISAGDDWSDLYNKFFGTGNPNSIASANAAGEKAKSSMTTKSSTTQMPSGGSVTQKTTTYDHGAQTREFEITNPDGTTKKITTFRGH